MDELYEEFYDRQEAKAEEMNSYTIKYSEGRKVYITPDKEELILYTPAEMFQKFCDARNKGIKDDVIFTNLSNALAKYEKGTAHHHYFDDAFKLAERVYEKRKDELPPLAEKQETPPKPKASLFSNVKEGT